MQQQQHEKEPVTAHPGCQRGSLGLVFSSKKCVIKTNETAFFGYGQDGIRPDSGFTNYLAAYIPHFADRVAPPRELQIKEGRSVPVARRPPAHLYYEDLKRCIDIESCLSYYNPQKEAVLEVDASQRGLLQDNKLWRLRQRHSHRHSQRTRT